MQRIQFVYCMEVSVRGPDLWGNLQLRLPQPVWLSGIKLGAVKDGSADDPPYVLVFARDLLSSDTARFTCIVDKTQLSSTGITNIRPTVSLIQGHIPKTGLDCTCAVVWVGTSVLCIGNAKTWYLAHKIMMASEHGC